MKLEFEDKLNELLSRFLFEENNSQTQKSIERILTSYLSGLKIRRVIKNFKVHVDDLNSTETNLLVYVEIVLPQTIDIIKIRLNVN